MIGQGHVEAIKLLGDASLLNYRQHVSLDGINQFRAPGYARPRVQSEREIQSSENLLNRWWMKPKDENFVAVRYRH